jgi:hypothetical protein
MSNLPAIETQHQVLYSVDINIPQRLHQQPVLANLIANYKLTVNFHAAVLDRKATGGGWFTLSLAGDLSDIEQALNYLRDLEIEIFPHGLVPIALSAENHVEKKQQHPNIDRLVTGYDL